MLAMHPRIQEQVLDEMHRIFPDATTPVSRYDLERLHLLERCINETLRLFPVVTIMARKVEQEISINGYTVDAGMGVAIGIHQLHRKEKYWGKDAHLFNPDHFLPERVEGRSPYQFIPFSGGPRNCIGSKYAMVVMKTVLTYILRNFRVTTKLKLEELEVRMDINIFLLNGHMVQIENRNY